MTSNHDAGEVTMNALVAKRADILFEIGEAEKRIARDRPSLFILTLCSACSDPNSGPKGSRFGIAGRRNRPTLCKTSLPSASSTRCGLTAP
jgi:hypothetical protein